MKLIRLTSDDPTAVFDCDFNGGITIPENSKIALQSVSANLGGGEFIVDSVNNKIIFQIADNYVREVDLKEFIYFAGNTDELFLDLTNKFNDKVSFDSGIGVNKVLGLEWNAGLGGGGRTNIQYQIGKSDSYSGKGGSGTTNLWDMNKTEFTETGGVDILGAEASEGATSGFTNMCILPQGCARGCGFIRARIDKLLNTGATNTNGMIIAFSENTPDPEDFEERDITFGIRLGLDNGTTALYYALIIDGVEQARSGTIPHITGTGSSRNDTLELMIDGNRVNANIYNSSVPGNPTTKTTLGFIGYENQYLFPSFIFKGNRANCTMNQIRFTPSSFYKSNPDFRYALQGQNEEQASDSGVNAPPRPPANIPVSKNRIIFQSSELANFLGYASKEIPIFGTLNKAEPEFIGDNVFSTGLGINGFIIQLLNINVESYDSLRQQRENILAVIPSTDGSGDLNYSPPFMIPIDLNNTKPMDLRNIRARIVRTDYSPFIMEGTGLINIVVV
tara:strand:- start:220 stop:1734 length:1515 start_codon:yes stop_codon:yes gene_type:complete